MSALTRDLTIEQGTSWSQGWQFRLASDHTTPAYDSTWSVDAQVRAEPDSATVLHEWSTAAGNASLDNTGVLILTVEPAESSAWSWTWASYDVEVSKAGVTTRVLEGHVTVVPEVTR